MPPVDADAIDRRIVEATQGGLPLVPRPYHAIAETLGVSAALVMQRIAAMQRAGVIRRIGVVPNHYRLGYVANGMSVWDVDDLQVDAIGACVGALSFVSHCYRRPRRLPDWPYNLFAMVHGRTREETDRQVEAIARVIGAAARAHAVLYSTRVLKKTGLRLGSAGASERATN